MYSFLLHLSFSTVRNFVLHVISSKILVFTSYFTVPFTSFCHVNFSLLVTLSQSPRIRLFFVLSGKKCCCNYFSSSSIIFVIFLSPSFYVMEQHQSSASNILYSLFCMPNSCYINIPGYVALTGSINILFKCFPCILSISFISSFFVHPYDSIFY